MSGWCQLSRLAFDLFSRFMANSKYFSLALQSESLRSKPEEFMDGLPVQEGGRSKSWDFLLSTADYATGVLRLTHQI